MKKLRSINYNNIIGEGSDSIFEFWEKNEFPKNISTPSVSSISYRNWIIGQIRNYVLPENTKILSLGCGNGFVELELLNLGYDILCTDVSDKAVSIVKRKGLQSLCFDIICDDEVTIGANSYDLVYADGLLGHIWDSSEGFTLFFKKISNLLHVNGVVLLSNDLCDDDIREGTLKVNADPTAQFFRPIKGYIAEQALKIGHFNIISEILYRYDRIGRGKRKREIIILRKVQS